MPSTFGARVSSVAVKGHGSVSKVRMSPKHVIRDGAESMLMGYDVDYKGVEFDKVLVGNGRSADEVHSPFVVAWVVLEVQLGCQGQSCVEAGRFGSKHGWPPLICVRPYVIVWV